MHCNALPNVFMRLLRAVSASNRPKDRALMSSGGVYISEEKMRFDAGFTIALHGESNTSQASPRMTIQRMCQPQEVLP